ncbi:hypothetical protein, partial [Neobacillus paridis]|uniref:hypothetical protein n=1 Tax=Neobacillus paridis TaxID=2803862 RepID=UPI001F478EC7
FMPGSGKPAVSSPFSLSAGDDHARNSAHDAIRPTAGHAMKKQEGPGIFPNDQNTKDPSSSIR